MDITLDFGRIKTEEELHSYIKRKLEFPDYYGDNLDALWDMLTGESEEMRITIKHSEHFIDNLGEYAEDVLDIFEESAEENSNLEVKIF